MSGKKKLEKDKELPKHKTPPDSNTNTTNTPVLIEDAPQEKENTFNATKSKQIQGFRGIFGVFMKMTAMFLQKIKTYLPFKWVINSTFWTLVIFGISGAPLLLSAAVSTFLAGPIKNSTYCYDTVLTDGSLFFVAVSIAGSSFVDYQFHSLNDGKIKRNKLISFNFLAIVLLAATFYSALKVISYENMAVITQEKIDDPNYLIENKNYFIKEYLDKWTIYILGWSILSAFLIKLKLFSATIRE